MLIYEETDTCLLNFPCPLRQSNLLDMTPTAGGRSFTNAVLPVGATWRNPLGHFSITVNATGANGATLTLRSVP